MTGGVCREPQCFNLELYDNACGVSVNLSAQRAKDTNVVMANSEIESGKEVMDMACKSGKKCKGKGGKKCGK